MKNKVLTSYFVLSEKDKNEIHGIAITILDTLESLRKKIGCELIEMPTRYIGSKPYIIVCDEEGTFKPNQITAICTDYKEILVGNLLIFNLGKDGDIAGLNTFDIVNIERHLLKEGKSTYALLYSMKEGK